MITPTRVIIEILKDNIILNNTPIRLIKQTSPIDRTPCITIDDSSGIATTQKHITNRTINNKPVQALMERKNTTIQIHVWCDNEQDREEINTQIQNLFYQAQSDHYRFCQNYIKSNGNCKYLQGTCQGKNNISDKRGVKKQCPEPASYGYMNLFTKYHIIRNTFNLEPPFSVDDLSTKQPVLHSIFKCSFTYHTYYNIGGNTINNIIFDEELL